jgi:hypothetical protein
VSVVEGPVPLVTCPTCGTIALVDMAALVALRPAVLAVWEEEQRLLAERVAEQEATEGSMLERPVWWGGDGLPRH